MSFTRSGRILLRIGTGMNLAVRLTGVAKATVKRFRDRKGYGRAQRSTLGAEVANGPNFAANYTLAAWGCGFACSAAAIVNLGNGRVTFPVVVAVAYGWLTMPEFHNSFKAAWSKGRNNIPLKDVDWVSLIPHELQEIKQLLLTEKQNVLAYR